MGSAAEDNLGYTYHGKPPVFLAQPRTDALLTEPRQVLSGAAKMAFSSHSLS
jgi:hypothetical protein